MIVTHTVFIAKKGIIYLISILKTVRMFFLCIRKMM